MAPWVKDMFGWRPPPVSESHACNNEFDMVSWAEIRPIVIYLFILPKKEIPGG